MHASFACKLTLLALLGACTRPASVPSSRGDSEGTAAPAEQPLEFHLESEEPGVRFRLSEAEPGAAPSADTPAPAADPSPARSLDPDATRALMDRVSALPREDLSQDFALREGTRPPPRTGATEQTPFPSESGPPEAGPEGGDGALSLLRYAPEGDVPMAPHLSLTFSQPMVAVTTHQEAARTVPVRLEPEPPGQWRWVGTRTLLFEPRSTPDETGARFPMATEYTVTVPASTRSALDTELKESRSWTFSTPPPTVEHFHPTGGPHGLEPTVFLGFDQRIDPQAVLPHVRLVGPERAVPLVRIPPEERKAAAETSGTPSSLYAHWPEGRSLLLHPQVPLEPATSYTLEVAAGTPSAEGPRTTESVQKSSFYTYDPLVYERMSCGETTGGCTPGGTVWFEFNNPLDAEAFDPASISTEPAVEGLRFEVSGSYVTVHGDKPPRSRLTFTFPASLGDSFGQALGEPVTEKVQVGIAPERLEGPGKPMVVLDPASPVQLSVHTRNHRRLRVRVWRVGPDSYRDVSTWLRHLHYDDHEAADVPGESLGSRTVQVPDYVDDELVEVPLDLEPYLEGEPGHLLLDVVPAGGNGRDRVLIWVQDTDIGLDAFVDGDEVLVWANHLADGSALAGVEVYLHGHRDDAATTDAQGLARLPLPVVDPDAGPRFLVARKGADVALLPDRTGWWNQQPLWRPLEHDHALSWFVFDDRGMYRPGERACFKGWVRRLQLEPGGDLLRLETDPGPVQWRIHDARGNPLGHGEAPLTEAGGFHVELTLPETPALGGATLTLTLEDGPESRRTHPHRFQIQEFRRPEFEVDLVLDPGPYVLGEHAFATVQAGYYAGGPLPEAEVRWQVRGSPGSFTPPNHQDWVFGDTTSPWSWWSRGSHSAFDDGHRSLQGQTGIDGSHAVALDFLSIHPPRPVSVSVQATVTDVNRQGWTDDTSVLLHPADRYVGLRPDRAFYAEGEEMEIEAVVVDLEGERLAGVPVRLEAARQRWAWRDDSWEAEHLDAQTCTLTSETEPERCTFTPTEGGSWRLEATVEDPAGRPNRTTTTLWVSGGEQPPRRGVEQQEVMLVPDSDTWRPGDVARVRVQAPFTPAEGLWTLRQQGLLHSERFRMETAGTTLEIPVDERFVPGVTLEVDLVGSAPRTDDAGEPLPDKAPRAAYASGSLQLSVPPRSRTLTVTVEPDRPAVAPGAETFLEVEVHDAEGEPVAGEVAVVVADESVLALTGYTLPDPLAVFYAARGAGVQEQHNRSFVVLGRPEDTLTQEVFLQEKYGAAQHEYIEQNALLFSLDAAAPLGSVAPTAPAEQDRRVRVKRRAPATSTPAASSAIALRSDFSPLALFAPVVKTDGQGRARVPLALPDNLTRYRVMAVAVSGENRFGAGESVLTARKPLMLRPSPPRFLNYGDRFELPLVLQNQTGEDLEVDLAVQATNAHLLDGHLDGDPVEGPVGHRLRIPARDRREIRIPAAAHRPGTARFQAVAAADGITDAARFELPVWTPATTEAFATYGEIDQGAIRQPVRAPENVATTFGGLEITTSSTALQALTDALLYLVDYPYHCSEQLTSRVLAVASLRDVLEAFEAEQLPDPETLEEEVTQDLARLERRQEPNGGWGYWPTLSDTPYLTVHVTHALIRARQKGFSVPEATLSSALGYLGEIESHIPPWYGPRLRRTIVAYSVYVRNLHGDPDLGRARRLAGHGPENLSLEAQAWILPVLQAGGRTDAVAGFLRYWENHVSETAATAAFHWGYTDENAYVLLHSSRRTDAVCMEALATVRPDHDLVPKLARGLLAHRTRGRWSTTQENSLVLVALDHYFRTYESVDPDFVARAWLGDRFAGEHAFSGRTTERHHVRVPMAWLAEQDAPQDLVLAKEGEGRLYYRLGLRYAPTDLELEPADHGFAVERTYAGLEDPEDVRQDEAGTWHVEAGARVRITVTLVAPSRRYHVALVDPLPAGLEPLNPELAVTEDVLQGFDDGAERGRYGWWWWGPWYQYQDLRDERAEAFTTLLYDGVYTYSYVATATTPGRFVVPPARAEEMYHPETFGRSATDRMVVQ